MISTTTVIEQMVYAVNNEMRPEKGTAIKGFDTKELPIPLKTVFFSFVPEKNSVSYFQDENLEFCQKNEATVRMTCYAPLTELASDIHELVESVLDFLNDKFILQFYGYTIGKLEYDRDVKAYKIVCQIFYETEKCAAEDSSVPSVTTPANFFCKTHVTDTDIHLTAEEHLKIREPYVTGTYIGTGFGARNYTYFDFKPSVVFIFRQSYHPTVYSRSEETLINYTGYYFGGKSSKSLHIASDGFYVYDSEENYNQTRLNEYGVTYVYIAFR